MNNAVEIRNLTKRFPKFYLDNISFSVPAGFVSGFIGENGAGKTTTLKLMLGMALKDGGDIRLMGKPADEAALKEEIGVLFEQPYYQEDWTPLDVEKAVGPFYSQWDTHVFHQYLHRFSLDPKQKFKTMSRGMKTKLGMAVTLSHNAKLLLLDEPTSGLDPAGRDEMLDIFRDYMVQEGRSIFFSTHITGDLEKIADYITYICRGRILYSGPKEELLEKYCLIRGGKEELPVQKQNRILGLREHPEGFEGLIETEELGGFPQGVIAEPVTLEDIMVYMNRREGRND